MWGMHPSTPELSRELWLHNPELEGKKKKGAWVCINSGVLLWGIGKLTVSLNSEWVVLGGMLQTLFFAICPFFMKKKKVHGKIFLFQKRIFSFQHPYLGAVTVWKVTALDQKVISHYYMWILRTVDPPNNTRPSIDVYCMSESQPRAGSIALN